MKHIIPSKLQKIRNMRTEGIGTGTNEDLRSSEMKRRTMTTEETRVMTPPESVRL